MRRIFIGTLVVLTIALINGCANRKITRVDPSETIDLSGRWNDSDSRLVSEEMIGDLLTSAWIPRYLKANDKRPVVVVGLVENKSHEHINSETFIVQFDGTFTCLPSCHPLVETKHFRDLVTDGKNRIQG